MTGVINLPCFPFPYIHVAGIIHHGLTYSFVALDDAFACCKKPYQYCCSSLFRVGLFFLASRSRSRSHPVKLPIPKVFCWVKIMAVELRWDRECTIRVDIVVMWQQCPPGENNVTVLEHTIYYFSAVVFDVELEVVAYMYCTYLGIPGVCKIDGFVNSCQGLIWRRSCMSLWSMLLSILEHMLYSFIPHLPLETLCQLFSSGQNRGWESRRFISFNIPYAEPVWWVKSNYNNQDAWPHSRKEGMGLMYEYQSRMVLQWSMKLISPFPRTS